MTVINAGIQFELISMRNAETVGILRTKVCVALHVGIFIQFEFKRIQILVGRPVYTTAISETPLAGWLFIKSNCNTWKEISVVPFKSRIVRNVFYAAIPATN